MSHGIFACLLWQVVQAASEDGKVKIKWGFDSSEAEVTGEELRAKAG